MVVIIGAGIAGAATAYYLSSTIIPRGRRAENITVFDVVGPAACSSGKAGAFLSESWGDGTKTEVLHRKSFQLHEELATELGLESYRLVPAFRGNLEESSTERELGCAEWLSTISHSPVSGRTAMVDPAELTCRMLEKAQERGVVFEIAGVCGLQTDEKGRVTTIQFENRPDLPVADDVVVALGPWSCRLEDWLDIPLPVEGVLSTSLVWENLPNTLWPSTALFCDEDSNGCHLEIFPRPNNSLFVSGCGGSKALSTAIFRSLNRPLPGKENPNQSRARAARKSLESLFGDRMSQDPVLQACIRPTSPDTIPIVGKVAPNVYVATGGGSWGITWGPLMGLTVACLLREVDPPVRTKELNPKRFDTLIYRTLQRYRGKEAWESPSN